MSQRALKSNGTKFRVYPDEPAVTQAVARHVASTLQARSNLTLGLATGNTFLPIYSRLVHMHRSEGLVIANATTFNLDEYVGLPVEHPASYRSYMRAQLFEPVGLSSDQTFMPGVVGDVELACSVFEAEIARRGGVDLQLLGVGRNGHIGFNEPGSPFDSRTRQVKLTASTREANARDFPCGEIVPPSAVTMGIATILDAREIIIVAIGVLKAEAIARAFNGWPDPNCPASALQLHPHVTVYCDVAAAAFLSTAFVQ